jgi:hypothetical protein
MRIIIFKMKSSTFANLVPAIYKFFGTDNICVERWDAQTYRVHYVNPYHKTREIRESVERFKDEYRDDIHYAAIYKVGEMEYAS